MIHIENLVKRYGDLVALNHLSLDIHEGEIFGLLGPNGSGKTTAINCLLSLLKYDKGIIEVFGQPMAPDNYQAKQQIGIVLQNVAVFDELTVYENIDYFCGLYVSDKKKRKELVDDAVRFVGLEDYCKMYPKKADVRPYNADLPFFLPLPLLFSKVEKMPLEQSFPEADTVPQNSNLCRHRCQIPDPADADLP